MRTIRHVEDNCAVSDGALLTPEELQRLRAHAWPRNFYPFGEDDWAEQLESTRNDSLPRQI